MIKTLDEVYDDWCLYLEEFQVMDSVPFAAQPMNFGQYCESIEKESSIW